MNDYQCVKVHAVSRQTKCVRKDMHLASTTEIYWNDYSFYSIKNYIYTSIIHVI